MVRRRRRKMQRRRVASLIFGLMFAFVGIMFSAFGGEDLTAMESNLVSSSLEELTIEPANELKTLEVTKEEWLAIPLLHVARDVTSLTTPKPEVVEPEVVELLPPEEIMIRDFSSRNLIPLENRVDTAWIMFSFLREQDGWKYHHIMSGMGNFMTECSLWFTPNYNEYYKGICQWEPARWNRLVRQGFLMDSLEGQLEAMIWEFQNHYSGVYDRFLAAESIEDATRIFANEYEVGANYNVRLFYAREFAAVFNEYDMN